jgi:hypothetical protein
MDLIDAIKSTYIHKSVSPKDTLTVDSDTELKELLFLQVAVDYARPRGPLVGNSKKEQMRRLGFRYIREDFSNYILTTKNKAFLIKKDNLYYHFDDADLAVRLRFNGNAVEIDNRAFVRNIPYEHPAVHPDGDICIDINWGERENIYFGHPYSLDFNVESVAYRISKVLSIAKRTLQKGYVRDVNPVTDISDFDPINAKSWAQAKHYAVLHHIDPIRIFDNDPWNR